VDPDDEGRDSKGVQRLVASQSRAACACREAFHCEGWTPLGLCGGAAGVIAECAARTQGAALLGGATVNLRVGPGTKGKAASSRAQSKGWRHARIPFCSSTEGSCKTYTVTDARRHRSEE